MLVEMAVADALGIGYEFIDVDTFDITCYIQNSRYPDMIPGHYSDDTHRSIANALMIISGGENSGKAYDPISYANIYQKHYKRDPRPGYSKRFSQYLKDNMDSYPIDFVLGIDRKTSNGSIMGASVLGWCKTIESVKMAAAAQALSTHSYATIPYAQIVALSAYYMINKIGNKHDLIYWLYSQLSASGPNVKEFLNECMLGEHPGKTTMFASSATKLMLYSIPKYNKLTDIFTECLSTGGDTDSSMAIITSIASMSDEYENDIPQSLLDNLENGEYGREYLEWIDKALKECHD